MDGQGRGSLEQVEWRAKDILESINRVRLAQNRLDEELYLGVLHQDVIGLREAWESLARALETVPEPRPRGPFEEPKD